MKKQRSRTGHGIIAAAGRRTLFRIQEVDAVRQCPVCGSDLSDSDLFCLKCGTKWAGPTVATAQQTAEPMVPPAPEAAESVTAPAESVMAAAEPVMTPAEPTAAPARTGGAVIHTPPPIAAPYQPYAANMAPRTGAPAPEGCAGYAVIRPPQENAQGEVAPGKLKPLSAWAYVGYSLLFAIPVAGLVLMIVFSCSDENRNLRSYARSWLIRLALCVAATLLIVLVALVLSYTTRSGAVPVRQF